MTAPLVAMARAGRTVTLIDKIEHETDLEILNGMQRGRNKYGPELTTEEIQAFARRRAELRRAAK